MGTAQHLKCTSDSFIVLHLALNGVLPTTGAAVHALSVPGVCVCHTPALKRDGAGWINAPILTLLV
jgi:hypothetical protein